MDERKIHEFRNYRTSARYIFSFLMLYPLKWIIPELQRLIPIDVLFYASIAIAAVLLYTFSAFLSAVIPIFRRKGCWWIQDDMILIQKEINGVTYRLENLQELFYADPMMLGLLWKKKCVLEAKTKKYSVTIHSLPLQGHLQRNESELWPLFTELRNRHLDLKRVNDSQGHTVDYWYRVPRAPRPKPVMDRRFWR